MLGSIPALEQSQATISEDALAEKQANLLGTKPLLSGRNSSKSRSRTKDPTVASKVKRKANPKNYKNAVIILLIVVDY